MANSPHIALLGCGLWGQNILRELLTLGARVVVIDDVITAGGSILQAIEAVRAVGCTVVLAMSIVDRDAGAAALLKAANVPYRPLVTLADLGVSNAEGQPCGELSQN